MHRILSLPGWPEAGVPVIKVIIAGGAILMLSLAGVALWLGRAAAPPANPHAIQASSGAIYSASFTDMAGVPQALGKWQQKLLVINFWATWCGPCKEEMPILAKLQQKYASQGLQIIGIAADSALNVNNFVQKTPINYPLLPDEAQAIDFSRRLGNRAGLLPHTVVVAPGGITLHTQLGAISEREFEAIIVKNLPK